MKKFVYPKESFYVNTEQGNIAPNYHMEKEEGSEEWKPHPGKLYLRMYYANQTYDDVDKVIKKLKEVVSTENEFTERLLNQRIKRLKHKLYGVKYHSENFLKEEATKITEYQMNYKGTDHEMVMINSRLLYEIESYLFQISSSLDLLTQVISIVFKFKKVTDQNNNDEKVTTLTDGGKRLINLLTNNVDKKLREKADNMIKIIEKNKVWLEDTIDMRNDVTHFSDLEGFSCFIQEAWEGGKQTRIWYPSMPDGQRAKKYVENTWIQLTNFLEEIIPLIDPR